MKVVDVNKSDPDRATILLKPPAMPKSLMPLVAVGILFLLGLSLGISFLGFVLIKEENGWWRIPIGIIMIPEVDPKNWTGS